ncbi:MAG: glycosyltransferase family 2 protein [Actinomycetota bacterium]|nr:glycosyltransferase family 2 protein [Actinomycetota bacterium]
MRGMRPACVARTPWTATTATLVGLARMGIAARRFLAPDPTAPPIDVRVVVPARDEAAGIAACVAAALPQATEVVVVDDGSSDGTADVAQAAGARLVRLDGALEPGWLGKPQACAVGAAGARTEWLAFVDADVVLHPAALATMAAATRATSTSIAGGLDCGSFWERLLLPELGLALVQEGLPPDFAGGQCFLVRRDAYWAVGGHGHASVRGSVVDDRDLARALGGHDARLAPHLMKARMYRDLDGLRAGLVKNQAGLHPRPVRHLAALVVPVATRRPWAAMAASAGGRAVAGQNPLYGVLAPVARASLAALYLESVWRARSGRPVRWKGRDVPVAGGCSSSGLAPGNLRRMQPAGGRR